VHQAGSTSAVRQFLAALVLLCFGISIPSAALSQRVCMIDGELMGNGICISEKAASGQDGDCSDCCKEDKSCCAELKKLPDSALWTGDSHLPDLVAMDLPPMEFQIPSPQVIGRQRYLAAMRIRGPDWPSTCRAVLAVWII
jgi:hypothetical protein